MKQIYQTRDIYLSAFLLLNHHKLIDTDCQGKIIYFSFKDSPSLQNLTLDYFSGQTQVEPLQFLESIKRLRHLVKDRLNNYSM